VVVALEIAAEADHRTTIERDVGRDPEFSALQFRTEADVGDQVVPQVERAIGGGPQPLGVCVTKGHAAGRAPQLPGALLPPFGLLCSVFSVSSVVPFCFCRCDREEPQRTQRTQRPDSKGRAASSAQEARCSGLQSASRRAPAGPDARRRGSAHPPIRLRSFASPQTRIRPPGRRAFRDADSWRTVRQMQRSARRRTRPRRYSRR
jgi:hypothetical protein